jgi:hypothetical protein
LHGTLARLEARVDNDRQRSRRNARRRRQRSASGRLPRSSRVPARDQHGRHAAGTPPALPAVNTPPGSSGGVFGYVPTSTTTTVPGVQRGESPREMWRLQVLRGWSHASSTPIPAGDA